MCQFDWASGHLDVCLNVTSGSSCEGVLEETSIWIGGLSEAEGLCTAGGSSLLLRAWAGHEGAGRKCSFLCWPMSQAWGSAPRSSQTCRLELEQSPSALGSCGGGRTSQLLESCEPTAPVIVCTGDRFCFSEEHDEHTIDPFHFHFSPFPGLNLSLFAANLRAETRGVNVRTSCYCFLCIWWTLLTPPAKHIKDTKAFNEKYGVMHRRFSKFHMKYCMFIEICNSNWWHGDITCI